jgi:hypothetical protein
MAEPQLFTNSPIKCTDSLHLTRRAEVTTQEPPTLLHPAKLGDSLCATDCAKLGVYFATEGQSVGSSEDRASFGVDDTFEISFNLTMSCFFMQGVLPDERTGL